MISTIISLLLHKAAWHEQVGVARWLLNHRARASVFGAYGRTPLYYACEYGHVELVRVLLEHGASVNSRVNSRDRYHSMTPPHFKKRATWERWKPFGCCTFMEQTLMPRTEAVTNRGFRRRMLVRTNWQCSSFCYNMEPILTSMT